ncbi:MAG: CoA-transferase [Alphaproteobacteria bacterium]
MADPRLLVATLARLLEGCRTVAVGALSPIPGAAALLARELAGGALHVTVLGSRKTNDFTDGGRELFDRAGQGRIDAFFLGGGEIDGQGNVNLVGTGGDYPAHDVRFPGTFGAAFMGFAVPRVILFREDHSRRVLVPRVAFISVPGTSPPGVWRRGGTVALVTGRCVFAFDRAKARFALASVHPGETRASVRANTGFDYDEPNELPETPPPTDAMKTLLDGPVARVIAETYPRFAAAVLGTGASNRRVN